MAFQYVALIRKDRYTDYWIDIPDLPGCVASGKTEEEAKANFEQALELHPETIRENGNFSLPEPRSCDDVLSSEEDSYMTDYIIEIEPVYRH